MLIKNPRRWRKVLKFIVAAISVAIALHYAIITGPNTDQSDGASVESATMTPKAHKLNQFKTHRLTT